MPDRYAKPSILVLSSCFLLLPLLLAPHAVAQTEEEAAEAEEETDEEPEGDEPAEPADGGAEGERAPQRPRRRRRRRGRGGGGAAATVQATFDHGEQDGVGLWLDPAVQKERVYTENWEGHRPVEVSIEADRITIRRSDDD